jgi:F-type H+-transporting ATPase subunit a
MTGMTVPVVAPGAIEIHPGQHPTGRLFGMTFNLDTIWVTVIAGLIVVALGFWARAALTRNADDHVPSKIQMVWETVVGQVTTQVEENLGKVNPFVVPLAVALFFFILIANWIEVIPTELNPETHLLPSPTSDTNLTYAMAIFVMVGVWAFGIKRHGLGGYLKHFIGASLSKNPVVDFFIRAFFTVLNVIEEITKPITLALRLFGNIFAGGIMIGVIAGFVSVAPFHIPVGSVIAGILNVAWKLFDTLFLGAIQAFIFALLTVLYFGLAGGGGHDEDEHEPSQVPTPTR